MNTDTLKLGAAAFAAVSFCGWLCWLRWKVGTDDAKIIQLTQAAGDATIERINGALSDNDLDTKLADSIRRRLSTKN